MSWSDNIQDGLVITTGDGKEYRPLYDIAPENRSYNTAEFEFPNVKGTLVYRGERKGNRWTIDFYFQGEDHLDVTADFKESADDKRPWTVYHPMHGTFVCHPASIEYDPSGLNHTKVSAALIETITDLAPVVGMAPKEQSAIAIENFGTTSSAYFADKVKPATRDINLLDQNLNGMYDVAAPKALTNLELQDYFNLFNRASAAIIDATQEPLLAITAIRDVILYPANFTMGVRDRLTMLVDQFNALYADIVGLVTPNEKTIFENNAGTLISGMIQSAITPFSADDYKNMPDVLAVIDILSDNYDLYLLALDTLSTDTGDTEESYIPDHGSMIELSGLVSFTISHLFAIAMGAKQERIVHIEKDSNLFVLTHRFLGLLEDDSTIDEFMRNNKIGLSEILQIKKDRKIVYYV